MSINKILSSIYISTFKFLPPYLNRILAKIFKKLHDLNIESSYGSDFLSEMKRRGIPVVLCNGRLSNRSFSRYRRLPFISKMLFPNFEMICTQTEGDARRFTRLGMSPDNLCVTGAHVAVRYVDLWISGDFDERTNF